MRGTYKAAEVSAPGTIRVVERPISEPVPGQVRIRVEACGICHTDVATVMGSYPGLTLPRVAVHEVIGRIEALGPEVSRWKISQRVGVGLIAGEDGVCEPCRRAFDTLFNKRDYATAEKFWSPHYIQHSAHIEPGCEGLFNLVKALPPALKYEPGTIVADGGLRD